MHINKTDVEDVTNFYTFDKIRTAGYTTWRLSAYYQGQFSVSDIQIIAKEKRTNVTEICNRNIRF